MPANLAVGLFFVLSSYVLTRSWEGRFGVFLVRRVVRLWPVYALCLAAGYIIAGVQPVWSEFLWYPLIGPNDETSINPPMWSLFLEVWAMPFMPLISYPFSALHRLADMVGCRTPKYQALAQDRPNSGLSSVFYRNVTVGRPLGPFWVNYRPLTRPPSRSVLSLPAQPVDATQALNLSAGVSNCKVSRGPSFS